jgi:hypothetical protein
MKTLAHLGLVFLAAMTSLHCAANDASENAPAVGTEEDLTAATVRAAMKRAFKTGTYDANGPLVSDVKLAKIPAAAQAVLKKFTTDTEYETDSLIVFVDHYSIVYTSTSKKTIAGYAAVAYGTGDNYSETHILGVDASGKKAYLLNESN